MSDSAKKKFVQKKLPFAISVEAKKAPIETENSSPIIADKQSRKRRPSNDGNNRKFKKRAVTESKENIVNQVVDTADSEEEIQDDDVIEVQAIKEDAETTPTSLQHESVLHIKLPSHSKSKRKVNMDLKPPKSIDEDDDDSVVYLDEEDILSAKKVKKSAKKKKKKATSDVGSSRARRSLKLNKVEENQIIELSGEEDVSPSTKVDVKIEKMSVKSPNQNDELLESIPTKVSSPVSEDLDTIHDEIIEMLSDDDSHTAQNKTFDNEVNKTPNTAKVDLKNLTPNQLLRRKELEARRLEKEAVRQKEREVKEQQRLKEKEQREEAKRKEKEEKEEVRRKEKEERDRKRQAEQDKKDEEKRLKEEERKRLADQRDEEKRQKEEERKRQLELREEEKRKREEVLKKKEQEEETRKKRAAEAFSKFFVAKKKTEASTDDVITKDYVECGEASALNKSNFMAFQVRERMNLAPLVRNEISQDQKKQLEEKLGAQNFKEKLYLKELRSGFHKPNTFQKTCISEDDNDVMVIDELEGAGEDIQIDESKLKMKHRSKYLFFVENRRPAFHGTWRKKSSFITARRPFAKDPKHFEYDVDSDDEWEEEEPGESLHGSDSEKEKDKDGEEDDYDIDNDFMVPHGHLSEEELQQNDDDLIEDNHPEAQKAKLKILQQEFAAEMKKKTEKIKPRLIGCIWMNGDEDEEGCSKISDSEKKYHCSDIIWRILKAREMMTTEDGVKLQDNIEPEIAEPEEELEKTPAHKQQVRAKLNDDHVKDLIKLVHGNVNSKKYLVREFNAFRLKNFHKDVDFQEFSGRTVDEKMMEISAYKTCAEEGSMFGKKCWLVKPEIIQNHYGDEKLNLPNEWTYILQKEVKERKPRQLPITESAKKEEVPIEIEIKPKKLDVPPPQPIAVKKRVSLLMSVPREQEFCQTKKSNLMSQYLKTGKSEAASNLEVTKPLSTNEVVVID